MRIFGVLQDQRRYKRVSGLIVESAIDYTPDIGDNDYEKGSDAPWIKRFSAAGGKVIISGDTKMMRRQHERKALLDAKMIVIFFSSGWDNLEFFQKSAFLLNWWPVITDTVRRAKPGTFWRIPGKWELQARLISVPTTDLRLEKINRQKAAQATISAARKALRRAATTPQPSLFDLLESPDAKDA